VLTCPTTSCFDGLTDSADRLPSGRAIRVFGDRFQISKVVAGRDAPEGGGLETERLESEAERVGDRRQRGSDRPEHQTVRGGS
jgi:hypothetical protein